MLTPDDATRLREALLDADFTVDAVYALLGDDAHRALLRNETTPAARRTGDGSPLATLTRLFSLQLPVVPDAVERALPGLMAPLIEAGLLHVDAEGARALADVRPYGDEEHDWWVVCDLTPGLDQRRGPMRGDHVLGISEASSSLAQLTVRTPVASALDLGTGCGVQALHLAQHAQRVVGTDVNPRALAMARLTALLNGIEVELRDGSLYEPVAEERFDLVATNPPFVISPPGGERLVYRDGGLAGDEVVRRVVTESVDHLTDGGWCQVLANWAHRDGQPWAERVEGWIAATGMDAWVLQREVADLPTYVEMWLADAGLTATPDYTAHYDRWLAWFEEQGIEGVGFGWLCLRNAGREVPSVRVEEWVGEVEQPLGPHVLDWASRTDGLAALDDDALLASRPTIVPEVVQETYGVPGAEDPARIVARLTHGVRRSRPLTTLDAGLLGALDGDLTVAQVADALAALTSTDPATTRTQSVATVRSLIADAFLTP